ncbi:hypothetical protein BKA93DRAFT_753375 [Sparassis latifolia]
MSPRKSTAARDVQYRNAADSLARMYAPRRRRKDEQQDMPARTIDIQDGDGTCGRNRVVNVDPVRGGGGGGSGLLPASDSGGRARHENDNFTIFTERPSGPWLAEVAVGDTYVEGGTSSEDRTRCSIFQRGRRAERGRKVRDETRMAMDATCGGEVYQPGERDGECGMPALRVLKLAIFAFASPCAAYTGSACSRSGGGGAGGTSEDCGRVLTARDAGSRRRDGSDVRGGVHLGTPSGRPGGSADCTCEDTTYLRPRGQSRRWQGGNDGGGWTSGRKEDEDGDGGGTRLRVGDVCVHPDIYHRAARGAEDVGHAQRVLPRGYSLSHGSRDRENVGLRVRPPCWYFAFAFASEAIAPNSAVLELADGDGQTPWIGRRERQPATSPVPGAGLIRRGGDLWWGKQARDAEDPWETRRRPSCWYLTSSPPIFAEPDVRFPSTVDTSAYVGMRSGAIYRHAHKPTDRRTCNWNDAQEFLYRACTARTESCQLGGSEADRPNTGIGPSCAKISRVDAREGLEGQPGVEGYRLYSPNTPIGVTSREALAEAERALRRNRPSTITHRGQTRQEGARARRVFAHRSAFRRVEGPARSGGGRQFNYASIDTGAGRSPPVRGLACCCTARWRCGERPRWASSRARRTAQRAERRGARPPEQNGSDRYTVATSSSTSDREGEAPSLYPLIHARATARGHVIVDVDTVTDTHPPLSALSPLRIPRRHASWAYQPARARRGGAHLSQTGLADSVSKYARTSRGGFERWRYGTHRAPVPRSRVRRSAAAEPDAGLQGDPRAPTRRTVCARKGEMNRDSMAEYSKSAPAVRVESTGSGTDAGEM